MSNIEELVKKKIDEIWNEEKVEDIVRHELEERIERVFYSLDNWIREYLVNIVLERILKSKIEKLIDEQLTAENIKKHVDRMFRDYIIENITKDKIREAINKIPDEVLKEQMVKNAVEEAKEIGRNYTKQMLMDILKGYCDMELKYLLNSVEELRTVTADLVKRVSRLEEKVR
jgi:hypothetical protein